MELPNHPLVKLVVYGILILGSALMLLPFMWMVSAAFKPLDEVIRVPPTWLPEQPTLDNFTQGFRQFPFWRYFFNSLVVSGIVVLGVLFTSTTAGYAFAKFSFPGRDFLFILFLASLMVPFQVRMIPLFLLTDRLGLVDTLAGVAYPWLFDAFGVFLMRQFIRTIPDELIEAARIDGASEPRIFFTVILPLVRPAVAALAIFTFVASWEEFLWPLIVSNSDRSRTLPVGLQVFNEQYGANIHWQMAVALVASLPMIFLFLFFQRQFIRGITLTGLKG